MTRQFIRQQLHRAAHERLEHRPCGSGVPRASAQELQTTKLETRQVG